MLVLALPVLALLHQVLDLEVLVVNAVLAFIELALQVPDRVLELQDLALEHYNHVVFLDIQMGLIVDIFG
jgi:hypothetical protein